MSESAERKIIVRAAAFSDIGPSRTQNQDAIVLGGTVGVGTESRLGWNGKVVGPVTFAVVDGMGGYEGGAEAAAIVATSLANVRPYVEGAEADRLFSSISEKVSRAGDAWGTPSMGATFASLSVGHDGCIFLNVGDCRSYKLGGGYLGQMSVDDRVSPESSAVTQAIGATAKVDTHAWRQELPPGITRYLLCTDGAWSSIDEDVLASFGDPGIELSDAIETMITSIYENHASDNCSAAIVEVRVEPIEDNGGEQHGWGDEGRTTGHCGNEGGVNSDEAGINPDPGGGELDR